ncbi:MAG: prepilin peptidase [Alphaproteobacteria bacterium]|nr:prepilin peptidase [Alphaproteobacteria bacterium]
MVLSGIIGFLLGVFLPAVAGRFGKILPADPGLVLVELFHKPILFRKSSSKWMGEFKKKQQKFFIVSFLWGIILSLLFVVNAQYFDGFSLFAACAFVYMVSALMSVDKMFFLLPDFFTIPLLVLGFTFVYFGTPFISMQDAFLGAWYGYFVSVLAVVVMSFFSSAEFGAGDAKMLTALGAWFGLLNLSYVLVLSFVFFFIASVLRKNKVGPFGPSLGAAALIVFFMNVF